MTNNPAPAARVADDRATSGQPLYETFLDDSTRILFRLIRPDDKAMLIDAFERLSDRSRHQRFFTHLESLSRDQLRYLTEVDHENHSAWVAIDASGDKQRGVAVGRWIRLPHEPEVAEFAVTVVDEFHRRGLGRTLLYLCARTALAKGIRTFKAWVLAENTATLAMLERVGSLQKRWAAGVLEVTVPLSEAARHTDLVPLELTELGTGAPLKTELQ